MRLFAGNPAASIMIVGDFPSPMDIARSQPFSDYIGDELTSQLHLAGISYNNCAVTVIVQDLCPLKDPNEWVDTRKKPKDSAFLPWKDCHAHPAIIKGEKDLLGLIERVKPNLIITLGNVPLKALTGKWGALTWRGSLLQGEHNGHSFKVLPTVSPRNVLSDYSIRAAVVQDLRRALKESGTRMVVRPNNRYIIRPNFDTAVKELTSLLSRCDQGPLPLSTDIETRSGHIACIGFAASKTEAICIPLMCVEHRSGYWDREQELVIWKLIRRLLMHPNAQIFGQNFLYDIQYLYRFFMVRPPIWFDTMVAQHCMFPGTPKGLDYLASIYCEHYLFWKNDSKEWGSEGEDKLWAYNCDDCCYTYEIMENQLPAIQANERLRRVWQFQQFTLVPRLLSAMIRGVRVAHERKAALSTELAAEVETRQKWMTYVLGHEINIKSPPQMQRLFYEDLKLPIVKNKKTKQPTTDDNALGVFAVKEPALRPVIRKVQELRSLGVFKSTFVEAEVDADGRMRSSFNPAGTSTFRLSSSANAFWTGINFQNIPSGSEEEDHNVLQLPNIRRLYIPDTGMEMFDMDLDRADLQVVVWEADDEELRQALRDGIDLHGLNAKTLFNLSCSAAEVKKLHNDKRQLAKSWVHGTNYGGGPRTMAQTCGLTIREAEKLQRRWFDAHPGIEKWHRRTETQLKSQRFVENRFGFRYTFFGRVEAALPEALAWVPQSTVACVINMAWDKIASRVPETEILIQVHDSLVGQYPVTQRETIIPRILEAAKIVIPYDKPLTIPAGIKTSTVSWGDCA